MSAEQREEAVFEAALQLPAGERAAFLDKTCAGDSELRRRVEVLLSAFERAGGFMKEPATPERTVRFTLPLTEKPGDKIGRYKIREKIGEGGCGVVYVAEQEEPVRRRVALKVVKLGMDTKQVIARFDAERQALAMMDHPNIARILDAGATDTGRPYFVMELVRGIRITDYCDHEKLDTRQRLELFIQVCQAVQHAHQKGVIHRDLKPSNILVTLHDGLPVPKVIDFGIAKATQGRLTDQTVYTAFEQFLGTPAYMSPEQAEMSGLDIDTRSDIYSLGVLLYELLTGRTPFDQKELLAVGLDEMRRTIREKDPPKPSTRLSTLAAEALTSTATQRHTDAPKLLNVIRGDLDWIVMKCLEKERSRRYETANGVAVDIQRHLSDNPVSARPPSRLYEFQKTVRRHKYGFAAATAIVIALGAGLCVSTWQFVQKNRAYQRATAAEQEQVRLREEADTARATEAQARQHADKARAQAEVNERKAQTEAIRSAQVAQFLQNMLEGVGPSVALGRDTKLLREILDQTANRLTTELTNQPAVAADLFETLGVVYRDLSDYGKAEAMLQKSLGLRKSLYGDEDRSVASAMHNLADVWRLQIRSTEAAKGFTNALAIRRKLCGNESIEVADSLYGLAEVTRRSKTRAEPLYLEALAIYRKSPRHKLEVARSLTGLAIALRKKPEDSEKLLLEAVAIQRELLGKHPELAYSLAQLGYVEKSLPGKQDQAVSVLREALAMQKELLGDHRDTAMTLTLLARTVKDTAEAKRLDQEALEMRRKVLGDYHPDVRASLEFLYGPIPEETKSKLLDEVAKIELQGVRDERLARALKQAKNQNFLAHTLSELVNALRAQGRQSEAIPFCWQLAEYGDNGAMNEVAWILATAPDASSRNGSNALAFAEKAVAGRTNAYNLDTLAAAYAENGNFAQAVKIQKEAVALLAGPDAERNGYAARLKLYQANKPYRDPYGNGGITVERVSILSEISIPHDSILAMRVAALQAWFGQDAEYKATCQRMIEAAERANDTEDVRERAARNWCLQPSKDLAMLPRVLALAREAARAELNVDARPWYQLALGMAEFRASNNAAAEAAFLRAEQTSKTPDWNPERRSFIQVSCRFYRAMILFRQGKEPAAKTLFEEALAEMRPIPENAHRILSIQVTQDTLLCWLAQREASALLKIDPSTRR